MDQEISRYLLQLRRSHPFLATVSLFATYEFTQAVETFATDGTRIRINADFFAQLPPASRPGLLLHVTLHTALAHAQRRGRREPRIWNVAADIVVNNIILESGAFAPPPTTAVEPALNDCSVEQVYEHLIVQQAAAGALPLFLGASAGALPQASATCHRSPPAAKSSEGSANTQPLQDSAGDSSADVQSRAAQAAAVIAALYPHYPDLAPSAESRDPAKADRQSRDYWRGVIKRAELVEHMLRQKSQGALPAGLARELEMLLAAELDWQTILWRFMARTPCDYEGFDRRFIHQQLYLDQLESLSLTVHIAVDTSGSIYDAELRQFLGEVQAIRSVHPTIRVALYYIDATIHGPYELGSDVPLPTAHGGGGTDFAVFFEHLEASFNARSEHLVIYLTDGLGRFPDSPPACDVLWVVSWNGLASQEFPFGEVMRLAEVESNDN